MQKRPYQFGRIRIDRQTKWKRLEPLFPEAQTSTQGDQKRASNRACLEEILWLFRFLCRRNEISERSPRGVLALRGERRKPMVVADGRGIPLGIELIGATPHESEDTRHYSDSSSSKRETKKALSELDLRSGGR